MAMNPSGDAVRVEGIRTTEPTFGLPATWIDRGKQADAEMLGYTVVDPPTVVSTHLTEMLKNNVAELISYAEVQKLLNELSDDQRKIVDDIVPSVITVSGIQRILQALLAERVSIRDLPTILEGIAEMAGGRSTQAIAEHVRTRLARQITAANGGPDGTLVLLTLAPAWERAFAEAIIGEGDDRQLAMAPSDLQRFVAEVRDAYERAAQEGELPVLLTSPGVRTFVRAIVERFRPQTVVMSQNEVYSRARMRTIGSVGNAAARKAA